MNCDNLVKAFEEINHERYDFFLDTSVQHKFSLAYRMNKRKIIRSVHKQLKSFMPKPVTTVRLMLIAVLLSAMLLTSFCAFALINSFAFRIYTDHSAVSSFNVENAAVNMDIVYSISEDSGYKLINQELSLSTCITQYCKEEKQVTLTQSLPSVVFNINTENRKVEDIIVNDCSGYFVYMDNYSLLSWAMGGYIFIIEGNIDKTEAINLAKLTKIK